MKKITFLIILVLAITIRFVGLASFPSGLNADEAALGYNAYSLLLTGRDEHGHLLPVNLESFADFKPALYAYLLVPLVRLFGLNIIVVRAPSALFGVISVILMYLFTRQLFPGKRHLPFISMALLAINPWAIHFSRGAWEVNLSTTFLLLGTLAFIRQKYTSSVIVFILSLYTYQSARIVTPLLSLGLVVAFWPAIIKFLPKSLPTVGISVLLILPLMFSIISSNAISRFQGVGFLSDVGPTNRVNELRGQHGPLSLLLSRLLHNRPVIYSIQYLSNYLDHFSGDFLFVNGDIISRNRTPETGLLYFTDFIFIFIGIIYLIKQPSSSSRVVWIWILVAPLAAALTFQTPHALRSHSLIVPLIVLTSLGVSKIKHPFLISALLLVYGWQFARFTHEYFVHYPKEYPSAWQYGFDQIAGIIQKNIADYPQIYVTDKYDQPYILYLFYAKVPPADFQGQHQLSVRDKFNFSTVRDFKNIHFQDTSWDTLRDIHPALIIAAPQDIPEVGANVISTIYFPNHTPAFKIVVN